MEKIRELCKEIHKNIKDLQLDFDKNQELLDILTGQDESVRKEIANEFYAEMGANVELDIWLYSFILQINPEPATLKQFIMYIKFAMGLGYKRKYFLFQQINSMIFRTPTLNTSEVVQVAWSLLENCLQDCKRELGLNLKRIPIEERNMGISIVLTEQYLSPEHGPTKTALDRCYVLKKCFGQTVMLINTAELLSPANVMYMEHIDVANYNEALSNQNTMMWQGESFNYYQCSQDMPNNDGIMELLGFIANMKPSSVTLIGGTSLFAGLVNELVPVITVGTIQSGLAMTLAEYQIIDQNMLDKGYAMLERMGKDKNHIIPGKFTFSLKPQTNHYKRVDLGIEDEKFALAMVGGRLTDEITDEFLDMLEDCMDDSMVAGIIGKCTDYDEKMRRHPALQGKLVNVGFVSDIQAVIENFDLYVNPTRRGGGTSVVEAMSKGLPAITVNYGDVAGIVGDEFVCSDYSEMKDVILKYKENKEFYNEKSKRALAMAAEYLDSTKEFTRIMKEYYSKQGYKVNGEAAAVADWKDTLEAKKYLSVIIPCYNVESYVGQCLDSIINQTLGIEHIEIITVNDVSTDNTLSVLKEYENKYPDNIKVVDNAENMGPGYARNYGVSIASAPYITFVDSDDWLEPYAYELLLKEIMANDSDMIICDYDRPTTHESIESTSDGLSYNTLTVDMTDINSKRDFVAYKRLNVYAWNKLYKKSFWLDNNIDFPEKLLYEDNYTLFLALVCANRVSLVDAVLYHWYRNPESITGAHKKIEDRIEVQNRLINKLKNAEIYKNLKAEIDFNYYEKMFVETVVFNIMDKTFTNDKAKAVKDELLRNVPDIVENIYYKNQKEIERLAVNTDAINLLIENEITDEIVRDMYKLLLK